jgi:hypothetical protein
MIPIIATSESDLRGSHEITFPPRSLNSQQTLKMFFYSSEFLTRFSLGNIARKFSKCDIEIKIRKIIGKSQTKRDSC